jgi:hypothetical protein
MPNIWTTLCPPAQIYPIVMTSVVLFNVYRGTYRTAVSQFVALIVGTLFLWVLCAANLEFAAYALLLLPVLFFVFLLAIIFYDQSLLEITSTGTGTSTSANTSTDCKEECDFCPDC